MASADCGALRHEPEKPYGDDHTYDYEPHTARWLTDEAGNRTKVHFDKVATTPLEGLRNQAALVESETGIRILVWDGCPVHYNDVDGEPAIPCTFHLQIPGNGTVFTYGYQLTEELIRGVGYGAEAVQKMARGGRIEGSGEGSDGILVQLDNSYILSKNDVEKYGGLDAFKALNLGEIPNAKS